MSQQTDPCLIPPELIPALVRGLKAYTEVWTLEEPHTRIGWLKLQPPSAPFLRLPILFSLGDYAKDPLRPTPIVTLHVLPYRDEHGVITVFGVSRQEAQYLWRVKEFWASDPTRLPKL